MATGWKNLDNQLQNTISIRKRDTAYNVKAIQEPKQKEENLNFWAQLGIMVGSMVLSSVANSATFGFLGTFAISYATRLLISNTVSFGIDLGTQIGLDIGMNRWGKSKQFLTMMPIFGMEWLGKTYSIHKVSKNVKSMTKSLENLDLVDASGNAISVSKELIKNIKLNPLPYIQKFQKNSNVKVAYKTKKNFSRDKAVNRKINENKKEVWNDFNKSRIKEMEKIEGQAKSQVHYYNNMLRKEFDDISIFKERVYNRKDFQYVKSKGMSSKEYDILTNTWKDGSERMYQRVSKSIVVSRSKFLPEFRINRSRANWSVGAVKANDKFGFKQKNALSKKWNEFIKGDNPRIAGSKQVVAKTTSQNLQVIENPYVFDTEVLKGFNSHFTNEIIAEPILPKKAQTWRRVFSEENQIKYGRNQARAIQNWAKYGRYANPLLAIKKAGRWTGDIVSDLGIKVDRFIAKKKVVSLQKAGKLETIDPTDYAKLEKQLKPHLVGTKLKIASDRFKNPIKKNVEELGEVDRFIVNSLGGATFVKHSKWIEWFLMAKDIANPKTPLPMFIGFKRRATTGKYKNKFGKQPVWSQPMLQQDVVDFLNDPGRYYLNNIAYGYGYSNNSLGALSYALPIAPLPVQGILYSFYRSYTATIGIKRAIKNLQNIASLDYGKLLLEGFVPTAFRSIGRRSGFGMITTNFIRNDIFTNGIDFQRGFQTFSTRKVSVMRRRNMRDKPTFVVNKRRR